MTLDVLKVIFSTAGYVLEMGHEDVLDSDIAMRVYSSQANTWGKTTALVVAEVLLDGTIRIYPVMAHRGKRIIYEADPCLTFIWNEELAGVGVNEVEIISIETLTAVMDTIQKHTKELEMLLVRHVIDFEGLGISL